MSSIDEVIERSRQPGEFSERKKFTVARSRAIQKMRQFALADASHYVLEWIQAAVANGATYLDLSVEQFEVRMSYVGGGFSRDELEALFDFLFASKDNLDVADVRQLALGVNALLSADPDVIVIESGDGTLEGTTRVELDGKSDSVYVGTPTRALEGTFIRATGLRRDWGDPRELRAIEERCLTATIPILVNDVPLFGYSAVRSPELFGYRRTLKFDEGDLYGTIGIATTPITKNFKLLTWGTWITTTRHEFLELPAMGGVIGYDRLRKTADHASIVQDEVYDEMWARLASYARQLASGQTGTASFDVAVLDGPALSAQQFRTMVRERKRAVVFTRGAVTEESRPLAARYGEAFDAPVFLVAERDLETVRHLGGPEVVVHTPRLDPNELIFFERPTASAPARPWLSASIEVPDLNVEFLADRVKESSTILSAVAAASALRSSKGVNATVFTPAEADRDVELLVELRVAQRSVWVGSIESTYPGHHVVVDLEDFPLHVLNSDPSVAGLIARAVTEQAQPQLSEASTRAIEAIRPGVPLSSAARRIVLAVVCRTAIKRLRRNRDGVVLTFALETDALPEMLLELPVVDTLTGRTLSIRDIEARLPASGGLVYATTDATNIDAELDRDRILLVDPPTERMLVGLLGHQSYVQLGQSVEPMASWGELRCGEFTLGLRAERPFPLLADGPIPEDENERARAIDALAEQLLDAWHHRPSPRVLRHLIWFVAHGAGHVHQRLVAEPLFRTADGHRTSFLDIRSLLDDAKGIPMFDGWSMELTATSPQVEDQASPALAMDSFVFHVLSRLGEIRPILDVDLTSGEAGRTLAHSAAFLESERLEGELEGLIGLPMRGIEDPVVLWLDRGKGTVVALRGVGNEYGVVGRIHGPSTIDRHDARRIVATACLRMYDRLIRRIPSIETDSEQFTRALEVVLDYSAARLRVTQGPDGSLMMTVTDPTAQRILDLPVFPTTAGVAVSPWRMVREFTAYRDRRDRPGRAQLSDGAPLVLSRWLDVVLDRDRITMHPPASPTIGPPSELDRWLTEALRELRTDSEERELRVRVVAPALFAAIVAEQGVHESELFVSAELVCVNMDSWLVRNITSSEATNHEAATWLLLAIYARINKVRLTVTNIHELHFQSRILDWLER